MESDNVNELVEDAIIDTMWRLKIELEWDIRIVEKIGIRKNSKNNLLFLGFVLND